MEISVFELNKMLIRAAEFGALAAEKLHSPSSDLIKQREAIRYLKSVGQKPSLLNKMVDEGLIKKTRHGAAPNSPLMYSKLEIRTALTSMEASDGTY